MVQLQLARRPRQLVTGEHPQRWQRHLGRAIGPADVAVGEMVRVSGLGIDVHAEPAAPNDPYHASTMNVYVHRGKVASGRLRASSGS